MSISEASLPCLHSLGQEEVPRLRDSAEFLQGQGELFLVHGFPTQHPTAAQNKPHILSTQLPSHANRTAGRSSSDAPVRDYKLQIG